MAYLRVKFSKHGALKYIGYLDVMRYFQKCIRRAELDIAYSGGFSPHQIMTFAQPLGVGAESNAEYMDIELLSFSSCKDVMDALNEASVPEIRILNVTVLPENAGNAMASVFAADYTVRFREGRALEMKADTLSAYLSQENIPYEKETKKGTRTLNLKDGIYEFRLQEDGSVILRLNASSGGNIKPAQVLESYSLYAFGENRLQENALLITREEIYTNPAGEEETPVFLPLDQVGSDT